ncbi:MAG: mechanosensitive ion channel [bacterium]|jgi:small conductance mechanosensitive channel
MDSIMEFIRANAAIYGVRIITAVIVFAIGWPLARVIAGILAKIMRKAHIDPTLVGFVRTLAYFGLLIFVIIAALDRLGVQTTSLVAILGAAGLAVGLALKDTLANFGAGVLIILFKPFKVGDFVDAGGQMGTVMRVSVFNTILGSPDNRKIILPNSMVLATAITNFSDIEMRRIDMEFGISYEDNIRTAKDILMRIVTSDERVLKDPAPVVAVSELADSSVNLVCRPWTRPEDYWGVRFDTIEKAKAELEAAGITIPFPQRDVHMFEEKKAA